MPISGCHDLPLATFNLPSRNNLQNKPNSAATMSLPCSRFATAQPQRRWDAPPSGGDSGYLARKTNPLVPSSPEPVKESPSDIGATPKKKTTSSFRNFPRG